MWHTHIYQTLKCKNSTKRQLSFDLLATQLRYTLIDKRTSVIHTRRDCVFNEEDLGHAKQITTPESVKFLHEELREQEQHLDPVSQPDSEPETRRQSERVRHPSVRCEVDEYKTTVSVQHLLLMRFQNHQQWMRHSTVTSLLNGKDRAMDSEYHSLLDLETCSSTQTLPIGSKWVF